MSDSKQSINLEPKDLQKNASDVRNLLQPLFELAKKNEEKNLKEDIFIEDTSILDKIFEEINKNIITKLNTKLRDIPFLENIDKVVSLSNLRAKMNGNDIKTLIDLVSQDKLIFLSEKADNKLNFNYNLQLSLEFTINLKDKQDTFIYNPKSAFITSNKTGLNEKIFNLANILQKKLANHQLNAKNIIDNVLKNNISYSESFAKELNTTLNDRNIKIEKAEQMIVNREELSFKLKSWHPDRKKFYIC